MDELKGWNHMMNTAKVVEVKNYDTPEMTRAAIFDELKRDLADWMEADRDLVWRPAIELTTEGDRFAVRALVPGVDPRDLHVMVAPGILLIKGETRPGKPGYTKLLRSVKFPRMVDPDDVHAEIKDGMLCVRAKIAVAAKANRPMPIAA
jgi:HSP20 family molecular chaperone IbpA